MAKYKVGDTVKIREDLVPDTEYDDLLCVDEMTKYCGKDAKITFVYNTGRYDIDLDGGDYFWSDDMFEYKIMKMQNPVLACGKIHIDNFVPLESPKIIFNPPATILFMNGEKYVSKVHDEEFDEEKGLLMCLAKAQGITHSELKRLIKNAKRS